MSSNDFGSLVNWTTFKAQLDKGLPFQEITLDGSLRLIVADGPWKFQTILHTDGASGADYTDYTTNYQADKNKIVEPRDIDAVSYVRDKVTSLGWHYHAMCFEVALGTKDSDKCYKADKTDYSFTSLKYYDVSDVEQTTQANIDANAVYAILDWEPTYNYDIVQASVHQASSPSSDIILSTIGVPHLTVAQGGSKVFVSGLNLKYIDKYQFTNGRTSKHMAYNSTYHTNLFRFRFDFAAGDFSGGNSPHNIMFQMDIYEE